MNATEISSFCAAVGEFVDAVAVFRKSVACQGEIAAMQAENAEQIRRGLLPTWPHDWFQKVLNHYDMRPKLPGEEP